MKSQKKRLENFIVLLLTGIFAVCVFLVLFTGVNTYRGLTVQGRLTYDRRTCAQYITTKIRQSDSVDGVFAEVFGDSDALVLKEVIGNNTYLTRIYEHNGYLMELFCSGDASLLPADGTKIMELNKLFVSLENGLLNITYADKNNIFSELSVSLRSKGVSE